MSEALLEIDNLRVGFADDQGVTEVIHGVSFAIQKGQILGLVGESGSGKSMIAKSILRILKPPGIITGGHIYFNGRDLLSLNEAELRPLRWRNISIVFQSALNALNPVMTIGAQIMDTLLAHEDLSPRQADDRSRELLRGVRIDPMHLDSYPHELSGGMRQRVIIAMSLALNPDLVIMDEPTTALDVLVEREILTEVIALQKRMGFSMLFITHDLTLLLEFADRIAVLLKGDLLEIGSPQQLREDPSHPYTAKLLTGIPSACGPRDPKLLPRLPRDNPNPPLLKVTDLSKRFDSPGGGKDCRIDVVRNVSFEINRGEIVALVGGSGSGKSTIAKMVCQLLTPTTGDIVLNDTQLTTHNAHTLSIRRRIQMVFQDPFGCLNPVHSVGHHLRRPLQRHNMCSTKQIPSRIETLLTDVGLSPSRAFIDKFPHEMSGGERQRVAIARVLAVQPDLIVADEPTSMLDVSIRMDILSLLSELRTRLDVAFLFITHDLASARYFADRILVLNEGRLVESADAESLISTPQHPYSEQLIKAASAGWIKNQTSATTDVK